MVPVSVYSLIVTEAPAPSILVLCPDEDAAKGGKCRLVPILIGSPEANQLGIAMKGIKLERPTTHDLFMNALTNLDTFVSRVEIDKAEGKAFWSTLVLKAGERSIVLDARPSDAIALALRQNAPIYITEEVLEKTSYIFDFDKAADKKETLDEFHSFIEGISPDDFKEDGED